MAISKKQYNAIATILAGRVPHDKSDHSEPYKEGWRDGVNKARDVIASDLAKYFADENEEFDRDRFLRASGVKETT